jgi:hypothetical protein
VVLRAHVVICSFRSLFATTTVRIAHKQSCQHGALVSWVIAAALGCGSDAAADPIQRTYRIQGIERCESPDSCSPLSDQFPLMLTFDSDVTARRHASETLESLTYGPPTFSTVPLPIPFGPYDQTTFTDETSDNIFFNPQTGLWRRTAIVGRTHRLTAAK